MKCLCGHTTVFHEMTLDASCDMYVGACEECNCAQFRLDPNWEPPDPDGWEGGFCDSH